jgi:hypothetical protein
VRSRSGPLCLKAHWREHKRVDIVTYMGLLCTLST